MSEIFEFFAWHSGRILAVAVGLGAIAAALARMHQSQPRVRPVPLIVAAAVWFLWAAWERMIPREDDMRVDLLLILPLAVFTTVVCALLSWRWRQ